MVALFGTMAVLALMPSISVLTVSARSASSGFIHGAFASMGVVAGDIIFIIIAIFGLAVLAEMMGELFVLVKYLGGTYLVWMGIQLWRAKTKAIEARDQADPSLLSSFIAGLLLTLGDQKAILFYLGLFPAFLDLTTLSTLDTIIIIIIATVTVGGAKLGYAFLAARTSLIFSSASYQRINNIAASVMISIGLYIILKA